jgi:hypothetical protein
VREVITGHRGRVWVDRELNRVLRLEDIATDIPSDFPISASSTLIDYDWVTINEHPYLLPSHSEITFTLRRGGPALSRNGDSSSFQARNDIRFRNYQKYGTEVKIIEDVPDDEEKPPKKP